MKNPRFTQKFANYFNGIVVYRHPDPYAYHLIDFFPALYRGPSPYPFPAVFGAPPRALAPAAAHPVASDAPQLTFGGPPL